MVGNWRAPKLKQDPKQGPNHRGRRFGRTAAHLRVLLVALPLSFPAIAEPQGHALPPGTQSVPLETQDLIEAEISRQLVLPQTALWQFDFKAPYGDGGELVCGSVNYQSAMRKYLGPQRFYAILKNGAVKHAQLQDPPYVDPTGAEAERFKLFCERK
jgi:hypothetical protein